VTASVLIVVTVVLNILSGIQFYVEPMDVDGMITCCFFFIVVVLSAQQKAQGLFSVVWKRNNSSSC
jgi:hypothetical protein